MEAFIHEAELLCSGRQSLHTFAFQLQPKKILEKTSLNRVVRLLILPQFDTLKYMLDLPQRKKEGICGMQSALSMKTDANTLGINVAALLRNACI